MNSDAPLGFACAGYPSSEVTFSSRDAERRSLVRLLGATPRPYSATKQSLARSANVGYFPCLTTATYVALPASNALGENGALKDEGKGPWKQFGPWAQRRLAALYYAKSFGSLSPT